MSKLDNNERWKTKMLLTEHSEQYEKNQKPAAERLLTANERTLVRDLILLPYIDTMVDKCLQEMERGETAVLKRAYLLAGRAIQRRVMADMYGLKRELKQRNIRVVPAEQEDFLVYHTIYCRGYQERFGMTRDEMRTQISLRLTRYTAELGTVLGEQFK